MSPINDGYAIPPSNNWLGDLHIMRIVSCMLVTVGNFTISERRV
jgi:hypothetical protein